MLQSDYCVAGVLKQRPHHRLKARDQYRRRWRFWTEPERAQIFLIEASATGWFLVRWLAIAFALESILLVSVPAEEVAHWLGTGSGMLAVPLAVAIGVI